MYRAQGELPPEPENSPDLAHYFSEGAPFTQKKIIPKKKLLDLKGGHGTSSPPLDTPLHKPYFRPTKSPARARRPARRGTRMPELDLFRKNHPIRVGEWTAEVRDQTCRGGGARYPHLLGKGTVFDTFLSRPQKGTSRGGGKR